MANFWTEEQQKVIDLRCRNILVSAAAGSGKTAVLVERILQRILDPKDPVDIDRMLIVTFTRAAASEMRERIGDAIQKKLLEEPDNEHLQRQETLLFHAQITTIDSFCQSVIRSGFHRIDLDPAFSIMDEGEGRLLRRDTVQELLEEKYAEGSEAFHRFVECFSFGRQDDNLPDMILQLYDFSQSYPWPERWLEACRKAYEADTVEQLEESEWMQEICSQIRLLLQDIRRTLDAALAAARAPEGPWMYEDALCQDRQMLEHLMCQETYRDYADAFQNLGKFAVLSRKKDPAVSDEKREQVKGLREQVKKELQTIKEQYFYQGPEQMLADMQACREPVEVLLDLAGEFAGCFSEKKRERNLLDFSDLEHLALQILVKEEDGKPVPTEEACAYADRFEEIMIDEYQDSNLVQELLLNSVSRCSRGQNNIFMVGDVKQSIYRFRLACPELFMEKYDTYTECDSLCQKVELHRNFRSRREVLEDVNTVFTKIMHRELGNVEYDDNAALYAGAEFPELAENVETDFAKARFSPLAGTELLLFDADAEASDDRRELPDENIREAEARMVGGRIKALVGREQVYDRELGGYRRVQYRDIVILLRSVTGWAESFLAVLSDMGIPAYTGTRSGYFSAVEVQTVLALLKIMDNPRQEIPFTAVLASPVGDFSTEELAGIRTEFREIPFYEACTRYVDQGSDGIIRRKLQDFFLQLARFRSYVPYTPMHELLWKILDETGYLDYVSAMPAGGQRRANLEMLVEKAAAYESTSYRGLFHFVRYIENLQKYEVDFGEASTIGEEEDTVRIMSIHKSKGLEFPVVFVSGLGKNFNQQDSRSVLAVHQKYGVGCDCVDPVLRVKTPALLKKAIQRKLVTENLGEEQRVLYVAMTRAKEKLYLTGSLKKLDEKLGKWSSREKKERLTFLETCRASSALEWVLRSVLQDGTCCDQDVSYPVCDAKGNPFDGQTDSLFPVTVFCVSDLLYEDAADRGVSMEQKTRILEGEWRQDAALREMEAWLTQMTRKEYPFEAFLDIQGKLSVSELKRRSQMEEPDRILLYPEPELVPLVPDFMEQKEESGAVRGTAMHHIMQKLDFTCADTVKEVQKQLDVLVREGTVTQEECSLVSVPAIVHFFRTDLGRRAAAAAKRGELYREKQFVIGIPASEIRPDWGEEELVLIQGIIDAWFYEDDQIVLADYKTDRVARGQEELLAKRYRTQLDYYERALTQMTGKPVKEKLIYSFALQESIRI